MNTKIDLTTKELWQKIQKAFAMPFTARRVVKAAYENDVMTVEYDNGTIEQYNGSCTVWHKMPMMKRCSTSKEAWLSEMWEYIERHGNSYPNSHEHVPVPFAKLL